MKSLTILGRFVILVAIIGSTRGFPYRKMVGMFGGLNSTDAEENMLSQLANMIDQNMRDPSPNMPPQDPNPKMFMPEPFPKMLMQNPRPKMFMLNPSPPMNLQNLSPHMRMQELSPHMRMQDPSPQMRMRELSPHMQMQELSPHMRMQYPSPHMRMQNPSPEMPLQDPSPNGNAEGKWVQSELTKANDNIQQLVNAFANLNTNRAPQSQYMEVANEYLNKPMLK